MKVMIVGAAGFVGSTTAGYLIKEGNFTVVSVDNLSSTPDTYNLEPARRATSRHQFYIADAACKDIMDKIMFVEQPDVIIFAIEMDANGQKIVRQIAEGSKAKKTLIICSHPSQCGDYFSLESLPNFDDLNNHVVVSVCRLFGPRQHSRHFFPAAVYSALELGAIDKEPNKDDLYEWLYIGDFFKALLRVIMTKDEQKYFCISSGAMATEADVIDKMMQIMGLPKRYSDSNSFVSNTLDSSALNDIGWSPSFSLDKAIEHTMAWYSGNQWAKR